MNTTATLTQTGTTTTLTLTTGETFSTKGKQFITNIDKALNARGYHRTDRYNVEAGQLVTQVAKVA
jgi:hypothetical protein